MTRGTMLAMFLSVSAAAAVPGTIDQQGRILKSDGTPEANASVGATFVLYDTSTGGTPLWTEHHSALGLDPSGYYSTALGAITQFQTNLWDGRSLYLGITLEGEEEMKPREAVQSVPYALKAALSDNAAAIAGVPIATTAPTGGQVLTYDSASATWKPAALSAPAEGGDLSGTLGNAMVAKLQGVPIASTAPAAGQMLLFNGTQWEPTALPQLGVERLVLNFEEGGGNTTPVLDLSGAGNSGTLSASGVTRVTTGHNNSGAIQFTGSGGVLTIANSASLNVTNNITVEAWINITAYPSGPGSVYVLDKPNQYALAINPNGSLGFGMPTGKGTTNPIPLATWTHVAATYDGVNASLYVNGALASLTPCACGPLPTTTSNLAIGAQASSPSTTSFNGIVDEVRISAIAKSFRAIPAYIKLGMSVAQTVALFSGSGNGGSGPIINFDTVKTANRMTSSSNGINVKAGHTYRLESIVNLYNVTGESAGYLGYLFFNGSTTVGDVCYSGVAIKGDTGVPTSAGAYSFHAGCLEIYTPTADQTIQVKIYDAQIAGIRSEWNSYLMATELTGT